MDRPWDLLAARTGEPVDEAAWGDAVLRHRIVRETFDDLEFHRLEKDLGRLPRGTVVAREGLIHDYPRLPRIFHLARGLPRFFSGPFRLEEKVDGYNVRIARVGGRALAFSRGGFVCPFATDRLRDVPALERFAAAHPRLVVCAEVAGPGNPYNLEYPPHVREDVAFFAFDLMELDSGRFLGPAERDAVLEGSGVPVARALGTALPGDAARVAEAVRALDREGCEGVVLKAEQGGARVKYVALGADIRDLRATCGLLGTIPRAFLVNRLVQAAFTLYELHEVEGAPAREEVFRRLGEALVAPMLRSIAAVDAGADPERHPGEVDEVYRIRMNDERNIERLLRHVDRSSATVQVKLLSKGPHPRGGFEVAFAKRYQKTTGYFQSRLIGHGFVD